MMVGVVGVFGFLGLLFVRRQFRTEIDTESPVLCLQGDTT